MRRGRLRLAAAGIWLWAAAASLALGAERWSWENAPRIVAVGDLHGAYDNLVAVLKQAELVDDQLGWRGGKAHLVQMGDVVDRGPDSRRCMDLLLRLEEEAERAGGAVHVLVGNHDAFNVMGVLEYVSPEEYASYLAPGSDKRYEREYKAYFELENKKVREVGKVLPAEGEVRQTFEQKHPRGWFEHREAFGPSGTYGRWIRRRNVSVRVNGVVFSHGDWTVEHSAIGIEEINQRVSDELSGRRPIEGGIIFDVNSPLQNRWLSKTELDQPQALEAKVDQILANLKARRLVVGHTVTGGWIEPRFGGKHLSVDAGMLPLYGGGHQVALEIEADRIRAVHPKGRVDVPDRLDQSTFFDYLVKVAAADPDNVDAVSRLATEYRGRNLLAGARDAMEQLFRINKPVAFRYRKDLGDVYTEMGEPELARPHYVAYVQGLRDLIEVTPANPHLKNLLARFCLDHRLELNLAEEMIQQALREQPDNAAFLQSLGRIQVLLRQWASAASTLEKVLERGAADYQVHFNLGQAYAGLQDNDKARRAFEAALRENPSAVEAREALRRLPEQ